MAIMTPPVALRQQCRTQVVNPKSSVYLPIAQFDIMINKINEDGEDAHDHQVAVSVNGTYSCSSEVAVSNKTNKSLTISKPSM